MPLVMDSFSSQVLMFILMSSFCEWEHDLRLPLRGFLWFVGCHVNTTTYANW